jgi:hypothetical protein
MGVLLLFVVACHHVGDDIYRSEFHYRTSLNFSRRGRWVIGLDQPQLPQTL